MASSSVAVLATERDKTFASMPNGTLKKPKLNASALRREVNFKSRSYQTLSVPPATSNSQSIVANAPPQVNTAANSTIANNTNHAANVENDIFTTKHTNTLIDLKKSYYETSIGDMDKPIFISYESSANLQERKFIVDLVRQLKENHLNDDIWFDRDEMIVGKPTWTVKRLDAAENSNAGLLIVTPNYFENQLSIYESKTIYDLKCTDNKYFLGIIVLYIRGYSRLNNANSSIFNDTERLRAKKVVQNFSLLQPLIDKCNLFINLSDPKYMSMSIAEKVSHSVGLLTPIFEKYGKTKRPAPPMTPFDESDNVISIRGSITHPTPYMRTNRTSVLSTYSTYTINKKDNSIVDSNQSQPSYTFKTLMTYKPNDVQQWLEDNEIDEYYRLNFADFQVDGYLLTACSEEDLNYIFDIENKQLRKKIKNGIEDMLKKELNSADNWHLQLKYIKPINQNSVYLIFDPLDHHLIIPFINELKASNIDIAHHQGFGSNKEDFMKLNAHSMSQCKFVLVYLTENASNSSFVSHECIFSQLVLGKQKLVTIMVKNVWKIMRHTLKAMLGDHLALDFTSDNLKANIKPLLQLFKPRFNAHEPLVKLEKSNNDESTLKSLDLLSNTSNSALPLLEKVKVFISQVTDHWETQRRLEQLLSALETFNIKCWFDLFSVETQRIKNPLAKSVNNIDDYKNVNEIKQQQNSSSMNINSVNIKTAQVLICCITPKYLASDVCIKDINLADALRIPIIPILLKSCTWPPENVQFQIRRILVSLKYIDISNDALLKRNLPKVISAIHSSASKYTKQFLKQSNNTTNNFTDNFTNSDYSYRSNVGNVRKK